MEKEAIAIKKGDTINTNHITGISNIKMSDDEDRDSAHATIVFANGTAFLHFDFRYNKGFIMKMTEKAFEFYLTAEFAFKNKFWTTFVDNLFSSTELLAKSILLISPDAYLREKAKHKQIQEKFKSQFGKEDNMVETLNKLSAYRDELRYSKNNGANFQPEIASTYLETVRCMIDYTTKRIGYTLYYIEDET